MTLDQHDQRLRGLEGSRAVRIAGPAFVVGALLMVPWTVYLAMALPTRAVAHHYDLAWVGFDTMLLTCLGLTGLAALRGTRWLAVAAGASAALLVVDAWFDCVTSPTDTERVQAVVLAVLVELPLAVVCCWLAVHTQDLVDREIKLLRRRRRRPRGMV